jgi:hypothetical protein
MADVLTELVAKITTDASGLKSGLSDAEGKTEQSSKKMADSLKKVGVAMAASGAAITAAMGMMGKAAIDEDINMKRLATTINNSGTSYDKVKDSMEALIATTQRKTGIADNEQRDVLNRLILVTNDYGKAIELLPTALDLAAAGEMDAATAATYLGKAYIDLENGADSVSVRFGQASLKFKDMEDIQNRVAGSAENLKNPIEGLKNAISDVSETIGSYLIPTIKSLTNWVEDISIKFQDWSKENQVLSKTIVQLTTGAGGILVLTGGLILLIPQLVKAKVVLQELAVSFGVAKSAALGFYSALLLIPAAIGAVIAIYNKLQSQWNAEALSPVAYAWAKIDTEIKNTNGSIRKVHEDFKIYSQEEADRLEKLGYTITYVGKQAADAAKATASEAEYTKGADAIKKLKDAFGDLGNAIKSKGDQARYASEQTRQALDSELNSARANYNTQMGLISQLYAGKIKLLNAGATTQINAIQDQIDAIDKQTQTEELALTRAAEQKRLKELDGTAYVEYAAEVARNELLRTRDAEKETLRASIEDIRTKTQTQEDALNEELKAAQQNEQDILMATEKRLEQAKIDLDKALEITLTQLQKELQDKIDNELKLLGSTENRLADEEKAIRESYARQLAEAASFQKKLNALYSTVTGAGGGGGMSVSDFMEETGLTQSQANDVVAGYRANPSSPEYAPVRDILSQVTGYGGGGIVTQPQLAMVGEAGPEAIIPLNEAGNMGGVTVNFTQPVFFDREDTMNKFVKLITDGVNRQQRLRFGGAYNG